MSSKSIDSLPPSYQTAVGIYSCEESAKKPLFARLHEYFPLHAEPLQTLKQKITVLKESQTDTISQKEEASDDTFSWETIYKNRVSCGSKHDQLMEIEKCGEKAPKNFGLCHEQIKSLFTPKTLELWAKLQKAQHNNPLSSPTVCALFEEIQNSVEQDILSSDIPFKNWQLEAFNDLKETHTVLIIRSSSNEDGHVVNAGGNETIKGVTPNEEEIKIALAQVIRSYFSLKSFKNRAAFEDPFQELPLCSVLIMEQIIQSPNDPLPIVSGVMMTNQLLWSAPSEERIIHVTASWGFGSGTSNETVCDEWAITNDHHYSTIRSKSYRNGDLSLEQAKIVNEQGLRDIPCLSYQQLMRLKDAAKNLESSFGKPMNVEFVFKGTDLYIVQARPIQATYNAFPTTSYLDPAHIPSEAKIVKGDMIISGSNQVVALEQSQILYTKNLEEAERLFDPQQFKAVVVCTYESASTHPAVNFASYRPPIPCLALPYNKWSESKNVDNNTHYHLCTQSGSLVESNPSLSIKKGLFMHPAHFLISIAIEVDSVQGESGHTSISELQNLLATTPELLKERLSAIQSLIDKIFDELFLRDATKTTQFLEVFSRLKYLSRAILRNMQTAACQNHMIQLAFHAGMLRQLIHQKGQHTLGAHSISGLEVSTNLPTHMEEFLKIHRYHPLICKLALFGLNGFDVSTQSKWLDFLQANHQSNLLDKLNKELELLLHLGLATHWLSENFSDAVPPLIEALLSQLEGENQFNAGLVDLTNEIKGMTENLDQIRSKQQLENLWKQLEKTSEQFINYCSKNKCKHPLIIDLIDLWDLSTKAIQTLQVHKEPEEAFENRVSAFAEFALQLSNAHLLNYSLKDLINDHMKNWGSSEHQFSVQHWIIPISHGALARIETANQKLTVLHQNLLQAISHTETKKLPIKLAHAYKYLAKAPRAVRYSQNGGTYISINSYEASVRINIPLNLHSTVLILSQKKGHETIDVTVYMRGSDNYRGSHLDFFKILAHVADIPLVDTLIFQTDLKVAFTVHDEDKIQLLGKAIYILNALTVNNGGTTHFDAFKTLYDANRRPKRQGRVTTHPQILKLIQYCLDHLEKENDLPEGFGGMDVISAIWDFLEQEDQLDRISSRILKALDAKKYDDFVCLIDEIVEDEDEVLSDRVIKFLAHLALKSPNIPDAWKQRLMVIVNDSERNNIFEEAQLQILNQLLTG